jgi:hypothetical protein
MKKKRFCQEKNKHLRSAAVEKIKSVYFFPTLSASARLRENAETFPYPARSSAVSNRYCDEKFSLTWLRCS